MKLNLNSYIMLLLFGILLLNFSCTQINTLNLQRHQFGATPTKIIWLQIAGLEDEHLSILKFERLNSDNKIGFEKFLCQGKMWEYNLFNLRPGVQEGVLAQLTGSKNLKSECSDYSLKPVWEYLNTNRYRIGIFENSVSDQNSFSPMNNNQCGVEKENFVKGSVIWKMTPELAQNKNPNKSYFHHLDSNNFNLDTTYYDKSCNTGECFSILSENIASVYERHSKNVDNLLYLIRDESFHKAVEANNIHQMKNSLREIDKIINFFQNKAEKYGDILLLVTSVSPVGVELPKSGTKWQEFERNGKFFKHTNTKLLSSVYAFGARAENFCGIYDQADLLTRIFAGAKKQGLEFEFINPFKK